MHPWENSNLSAEERAELLVSAMTLEEKVSQMSYQSPAIERLGVPAYVWWNEALHGVARAGTATVFPQSIGLAATFDPSTVQRVAEITAEEARVKHLAAASKGDRGIYKGLTMWSPNVNIFRDPRWGRGHETYGEDPYLTSRMGVAFIRGLQGPDPEHPVCDATAKHFAVHSGPEEARHHFDAVASPRDMSLTYLPAFRAAVQEGGVKAVMGAYNRVNGEAACASPTLLEKTLRGEWGFRGYVVSDCGAIEDIYAHHRIAEDRVEAAALAVNNGCDLCCGMIFPCLVEAVQRGLVSEAAIDRSAKRLLTARFRLGLMDPLPPVSAERYLSVDSEAHRRAALEAAEASLVLLKNEGGLLPLQAEQLRTIAVIGPNADSRKALVGNYNGTPSETWTVLEGIRREFPGVRVLYAEGCSIMGGSSEAAWGETPDYRIAEALQAAELADAIVLVTGLNGEMESEENNQGYGLGDREGLDLPESQRELVKAVTALGKPVTLVNMTGSAVTFPCEDKLTAIVQAWYPGEMGGVAVARLLRGAVRPTGRLPLTFYRSTEQLPPFEDYSMAGRTYRYFEGETAYPFGWGLGWTECVYGAPQAVRSGDGGLDVLFTVENPAAEENCTTAQCYLRWLQPAEGMPNVQLVGFERLRLAAGEKREVCLRIDPRQLQDCLADGSFADHRGGWELAVGSVQPSPGDAWLRVE